MFQDEGYDVELIKRENIVQKLNLVELLERQSPYERRGKWGDIPYHARVHHILRAASIPAELKPFALALFANIIYLPRQIVQRLWRLLGDEIVSGYRLSRDALARSIHIFQVDPEGFDVEFVRENAIEGRLDTDQFARISTVGDLMDKLNQLPAKDTTRTAIDEIYRVITKPYWLLLTDNVLSGTSLTSELRRLLGVRQLLWQEGLPGPEKIIVCAQVYTGDARAKISSELQSEAAFFEIRHGLFFGNRFKINSEECRLFTKETLSGVRDLCGWFADNFLSLDERLRPTAKVSGDHLQYGFKGVGLPLVVYKNAPSDSIPLLWYAHAGWHDTGGERNAISSIMDPPAGTRLRSYAGPFPRLLSRLAQRHGMDENKLEKIRGRWDRIAKRLKQEG